MHHNFGPFRILLTRTILDIGCPLLHGPSRSLRGNGLVAEHGSARGPFSPPTHHQSNFSLRTSEESKPLLYIVHIRFWGPQVPLLSHHAFRSLLHIYFFHHAMTLSSQRNLFLVLELFVVLASSARLNYSGIIVICLIARRISICNGCTKSP